MGRLIHADRDGASFRTTESRSRQGIEFLALVRVASVPVLLQLRKNHERGPKWKRVAINRALARQGHR